MPKTVMVVDDDRTTADVLSQMIRVLGHQAELSSPSDCLHWLESNTPDLAILDIHMYGIDGVELFSRIRERGQTFPIVILTGQPESPLALRAKAQGAVAVVGKPMSINILQGLLELSEQERSGGPAE